MAQWNIEPLRHALNEVLPRGPDSLIWKLSSPSLKSAARTIWLNGCRVAGKDKPVSAILLALEDVTLRRRAEEGLKRSNVDLEQFASMASHDLREPLRTIGCFF